MQLNLIEINKGNFNNLFFNNRVLYLKIVELLRRLFSCSTKVSRFVEKVYIPQMRTGIAYIHSERIKLPLEAYKSKQY